MMAQRYFPGSNTCRGFVGFFQDLLPRTEQARILLIKGGPGCGKSTLMRAAAERWEAQGRPVEYYLCASDPDSLDAVVCGDTVVLDATLPHALEPELTRVTEQVIDLSECLDERSSAPTAHRRSSFRWNAAAISPARTGIWPGPRPRCATAWRYTRTR